MNGKTYSKAFLWRQRIGFGISDYACNLAYLMVNTYLLIYYTDVAGISAAAAGFMFLITKFFDAFTDYMVGTLIDKTNTRMGRNRPWMLAGAPVLAIGMILLFTAPDFGTTGKLAWAYFTYMLFSFGYTLVNIPMASILPTLSADPIERTNIATSRSIFSSLGSLTSASMALFLIAKLGGDNVVKGYFRTNLVFGVIVVIILLICVASIREVNPAPQVVKKTSVFHDFKCLMQNKPYLLMAGDTYFLFVGYLGMFAAIAYYFKYIVGNEMQTSAAISIMTIAPILTMLLSPVANKRFGKKDITQFGTLVGILGFILVGISGGNTSVIYAGILLAGLGNGFRTTMYYSMLADVVDYGEWKFKKNLAGTQAAVSGFVNKVASASASAIVAWLLSSGGYDGTAAVQSPAAQTSIIAAFVGLPILCNAACMILLHFYKLDKGYGTIKKELEERKAAVRMNETALES